MAQNQPPSPSATGADAKDDQPRSGLKKRRIQQACRPCGIKRVKCDGSHPCITCIRSGEVCEYGQPKKRGPPKGSTRGTSKAAKRNANAHPHAAPSAPRKNAHDAAAAAAAAAAQPVQSTRDYLASAPSAAASTTADAIPVPLSRPPPPPYPDSSDWSRSGLPPPAASNSALASSSRFPPPPSSAQAHPHSIHRSDDSIRPPTHPTCTPTLIPDRVMPPRKEATVPKATAPAPAPFTTAASIAPAMPRVLLAQFTIDTTPPAPLIRTSHAQRPSTAEAAAALASSALHLAPRTANCPRSTFSAHALPTGRPLRQETTEDSPSAPIPSTPPSPARSGASRPVVKSQTSHTRPAAPTSHYPPAAPYAAHAADSSRLDHRLMPASTPASSHVQPQAAPVWSAQPRFPPQSDPLADPPASTIPTGIRQSHTSDNNQLLVEGTLLQLQRDRDSDRKPPLASTGAPTSTAPAPNGVTDDVNLEPLLWVEPGEDRRSGVDRPGVSLTKPEIPPLIQERLFTIFWGIVQTIWPALYKPALCLTGFNVIDAERHPMLHNAACALAAVAWDSGECGVSEQDTEATQSDWVERTASDLSFSQGPGQLGDGTSLRRLSAADLGDIFLARAKYYLVKTNNEPSLETIQSLFFMALREGGNGRASQASAYLSTACRMSIDLGLHRQRDFSSVLGLHFSHAEEQARRRIFWCLFLLDKTSSASLGRPVTLRWAEIDCPLPNSDEVDEKETWAETTNNSSLIKDRARNMLLKTPIAAMTHLRFGVRLGQICEQVTAIYTQVRRPDADPGAEGDAPAEDPGKESGGGAASAQGGAPEWESRLIRLHGMLEAWERDLPHRLRFEEPAHRLPNTLSQHLWFQVCKLILHRPYILKQSSRADLPPSHRICTDAVGKICDILTAYDNNFGMRKLSSTFTYCIFTASTIEIANTTSTDASVALEAKRRLRKFMTWLSRMSGTWQSATHHLKILEQLGHGIDADLDGTGLPSHREASTNASMVVSRADSPSGAMSAGAGAGAGTSAKETVAEVGVPSLSLPKDALEVMAESKSTQVQGDGAQHEQGDMHEGTTAVGASEALQQAGFGEELGGLSVPGPIGGAHVAIALASELPDPAGDSGRPVGAVPVAEPGSGRDVQLAIARAHAESGQSQSLRRASRPRRRCGGGGRWGCSTQVSAQGLRHRWLRRRMAAPR
ncbi:hypothetical protein L1887_58120 [Cichorium endivia]|nr:hypothetical protein L1887_58120 [Cichorium endivia]